MSPKFWRIIDSEVYVHAEAVKENNLVLTTFRYTSHVLRLAERKLRSSAQAERWLTMSVLALKAARQTLLALASVLIGAASHQSHAQPNEAALVLAMRNLGAHWYALTRSPAVLIVRCPNNTYRGIRPKPGAVVSVDLRRTDSLMNPYVGIVRITGEFQGNGSSAARCHKTPSEARQDGDWHGNDRIYNMEAYYTIEGNELVLSGGNEVFKNQFLFRGPPYLDVTDPWIKGFRFPLM